MFLATGAPPGSEMGSMPMFEVWCIRIAGLPKTLLRLGFEVYSLEMVVLVRLRLLGLEDIPAGAPILQFPKTFFRLIHNLVRVCRTSRRKKE